MRPSVSALLPVHDGIEWIARALTNIESIMSHKDEIIIVDNGSTDGTVEFLKRYRFKYSTIVLYLKEKNLVNALNEGIEVSKNTWIARFDVDDLYEQNRIEKLFSQVTASTVAVFSDFKLLDDKSNEYGQIYNGILDSAIKLSLPRSERNPHPSVLFRKKDVIEVGGYLNEDYPCEDLSLWLRLSKQGSFHGFPSPLLHYSLLQRSVSATNYELIKTKSSFLVRKYFDTTIVCDAYDQLASTLETYNSIPNSLERKLLHLRDFLHPIIWEQLRFLQKMKLIFCIFGIIIWPKAWKVIFVLHTERKGRFHFRFLTSKGFNVS